MRQPALIPLALVLATGAAFATPVQARSPHVPVTQPLVILLQDHVAHASANTTSRIVEPVAAVRPLTKVRTVLPVMGLI
jgi:hypothetical protein